MAIELTIGRLAHATGCKIPTIRSYEKFGLLPAPRRSNGNTRLYGASHVDRLGFIQHCRELGFPQTAVRELLELSDHPDQSCEGHCAYSIDGRKSANCPIACSQI